MFQPAFPAPLAPHEEVFRFLSESFPRQKSDHHAVLRERSVPVVEAHFGQSSVLTPITVRHLNDAHSSLDSSRMILGEVQADAIGVRPEFGSGRDNDTGLMPK